MSHTAKLKCMLKGVNAATLKKAMESLVKQLGGELVGKIEQYSGNDLNVGFGWRHKSLNKRGYGVNLKNGSVEVVGDDFSQSFKLADFRKAVTKEYNATAFANVLRKKGFAVSASRNKDRNSIVLKAVQGGGVF